MRPLAIATVAVLLVLGVPAALHSRVALAGVALGTLVSAGPGFVALWAMRSGLAKTSLGGPNLVLAATTVRMLAALIVAGAGFLLLPRADRAAFLLPFVTAYLLLLVADAVVMARVAGESTRRQSESKRTHPEVASRDATETSD